MLVPPYRHEREASQSNGISDGGLGVGGSNDQDENGHEDSDNDNEALGSGSFGDHTGAATGQHDPSYNDAHWSPVVIDLDGDGVEINHGASIFFDVDNDGYKEQTSWVAPDDGFLVLDLNPDGSRGGGDDIIDQARELAFALWGDEGDTDLQVLRRAFDVNNHGILDANDDVWDELRIWQDLDQHGVTDDGELKTLADWGITNINLNYDGENPQSQQEIDAMYAKDDDDIPILGNTLHGLASYTRNGEVVSGGVGDDVLNGGDHDDTLRGGAGNDTLYTWRGDDLLEGADGDDAFHVEATLADGGSSQEGWAILHGGTGDDTAYVTGQRSDWSLIKVEAEKNQWQLVKGPNVLDLVDIETLQFSDGNSVTLSTDTELDTSDDYIRHNPSIWLADNHFEERDRQKYHFVGENLYWEGPALDGWHGNDLLDGHSSSGLSHGHEGTDLIWGGAHNDNLYGGSGSDFLSGESGEDSLSGDAGSDTLYGGMAMTGFGAEMETIMSGSTTVMMLFTTLINRMT